MRKLETHFSLSSSFSLGFQHSAPLSPGNFPLWPSLPPSLLSPFLPVPRLRPTPESRRTLHNVSGVQEEFMDANFM